MKPLSSPYLQKINPPGLLEILMIALRFLGSVVVFGLLAFGVKYLLGLATPEFHDDVFLYLKGNFYAKYFPFSLAFLGVLVLLAAYNVFAFVSGRSMVRSVYLFLIRRFLHVPGFGKTVMFLARVTCRLRLRPKLLENVIVTDCAICLDAQARNLGKRSHGRRMKSIARLLPEITKMSRPPVALQLKNLEMMLRALILFELRTGGSSSSPLAKTIAASGLQLIRCLSSSQGVATDDLREIPLDSFRYLDLLPQVELVFNQFFPKDVPAEELENSLDSDGMDDFQSLLRQHQQREKLFVGIGLKIEACFFSNASEPLPEQVAQISGLVDEDVATARASGDLALGLALYLSMTTNRFEIINGYKNAVEVLEFCLDLLEEKSDSSLSLCKYRLLPLTACLDEPWTHGLLAEVKQSQVTTRHLDWLDSAFQENGILHQEDFVHAARPADSESLHAGPDFDPHSATPVRAGRETSSVSSTKPS